MNLIKSSFLVLAFFSFISGSILGQEAKPKLYNPLADAKTDIANAVTKAKAEGKHVLIQVGGDW